MTMNWRIFTIVLKHELRILTRNKVLLYLFFFTFMLLTGALSNGVSAYRKQQKTIAEIEAYNQQERLALKNKILDVEKNGGVYNGYIWDDPTFAYVMASRYGSKYAIKNPFPLQALNIGQSDIQPFYYKVNTRSQQYLTHESEIENNYLLLLGAFDFSFLVIYLIPLLIIVFTYNILSSENEQGTWVLLKTSNQSISKLILYRILIRFFLLTIFFWSVVIVFLLFVIPNPFMHTSNWWLLFGVVSLYFAFWFALAFFVNSFSRSSNINLLILMSFWLFTSVILPNMIQSGIDMAYPIPSRIKLVSKERQAVNKYYVKDGKNLSQELLDNPLSMIRSRSVVTPELIYGYGILTFSREQIMVQASSEMNIQLEGQLLKQQMVIQNLMHLSPALMLQEELSALTGTHFRHYKEFGADVQRFKEVLIKYFTPKVIDANRYHSFTVEELQQIPSFHKKVYPDFGWMNIPAGLFYYIMLIGILLLTGFRKLLKSNKF